MERGEQPEELEIPRRLGSRRGFQQPHGAGRIPERREREGILPGGPIGHDLGRDGGGGRDIRDLGQRAGQIGAQVLQSPAREPLLGAGDLLLGSLAPGVEGFLQQGSVEPGRELADFAGFLVDGRGPVRRRIARAGSLEVDQGGVKRFALAGGFESGVDGPQVGGDARVELAEGGRAFLARVEVEGGLLGAPDGLLEASELSLEVFGVKPAVLAGLLQRAAGCGFLPLESGVRRCDRGGADDGRGFDGLARRRIGLGIRARRQEHGGDARDESEAERGQGEGGGGRLPTDDGPAGGGGAGILGGGARGFRPVLFQDEGLLLGGVGGELRLGAFRAEGFRADAEGPGALEVGAADLSATGPAVEDFVSHSPSRNSILTRPLYPPPRDSRPGVGGGVASGTD